MQKEIYIIRHGETDLNKQGIVQGRGVNSSLNERGRRQAQAFFNQFGKEGFDVIYTSSLLRAQQTVQPFVEAGYIIHPHHDLDEISWGIYEGKLPDSATSQDYVNMLKKWRSGILSEKIPGGESPVELQQRQLRFIENVLKPAPHKKILLCIHGRAMRSLLCTLLDVELSKMDDYPHRNLSLYKLFYDVSGFRVDWFNYTEHVNGL